MSYYADGVTDALTALGLGATKTAARAALRRIKRMIDAGQLDKADALARTPGVLKDHPLGSYIRPLSRRNSSEGASFLVAHPRAGVAAGKLYDDAGFTTPLIATAKERLHSLEHPNIARLRHSVTMPGETLPVHFFDYLPGRLMSDPRISEESQLRGLRARGAVTRAGAERGLIVTDLHGNNMMELERSPGSQNYLAHLGDHVAFDTRPLRAGISQPAPTGRGNHVDPVQTIRTMMQRMTEDNQGIQRPVAPPPPTTGGTPVGEVTRRAEPVLLF